jgi:hypothetical protein
MRPFYFGTLLQIRRTFLNALVSRWFSAALLAPDTELWYQWFASFVSLLERICRNWKWLPSQKQMGRLLTMLSYQSGNMLNNSTHKVIGRA